MDKIVIGDDGVVKFTSRNLDDTAFLAQKIADKLNGGEVILLNGQLGAGKTAFTKCLARSLGVEDIVTSPTFTFMKEYKGRISLYHFDMYRALEEDELYELGLHDYLYMDGVCVIEWNKFQDLPKPIVIDIDVLEDDSRLFRIRDIDVELF